MGSSTSEQIRLQRADDGAEPWRKWGPYVAERAWGTVREDYSAHGEAWDYFPHDHARSRAYRWSEDGLAGVCDERQTFCLALALWNGADPILKERLFGLTGPEGNHGEDVKECSWYLDSTPTHSWMSWRYHYPQRAFPYSRLVHHGRDRTQPEYELLDTGVFEDDRYWGVTVDYAKAGPADLCMRITIENPGPDPSTLHVLPTLWFRNTWAWGLPGQEAVPRIRAASTSPSAGGLPALVAEHAREGKLVLVGEPGPTVLLCDNESNAERLWAVPGRSPYPKDGINDHVVNGSATVNPAGEGTKGCLWYRLEVPAGDRRTLRLRLSSGDEAGDIAAGFEQVMTVRRQEADAYYAALTPPGASADEALVLRQAMAGMLWGKQFYHYEVDRWLDGDPASPPPPRERLRGRNSGWRHLRNADVISMPDTWEYPWYASWDLAFHCVPLAHLDPQFAKEQLILILREWYTHPSGQVPAYEWALGDVNPPVHAWAALRVFECDGSRDVEFLARVFHKLLINFTWWVNRKDSEGDNVFEGGFLGLDNIGPIDRSETLPVAGVLEQSDGTAWMAMYCLNMLEMALVLAQTDAGYEDVATKFFQHFALIAAGANEQLWDEEDGFFYDVLSTPDGRRVPFRVRSLVGLLPLAATTSLDAATLRALPRFGASYSWFTRNRPEARAVLGHVSPRDDEQLQLLAVVGPDKLPRVLARLFDEAEFLSPHGVRSLSREHLEHPFVLDLPDGPAVVGYQPGESTSATKGGNSNWRGPVWFPVNMILVDSLRRFARFYGDDFKVDYPTGSGAPRTLAEAADDLEERLIGLFLRGPDGRRPVFGDRGQPRTDPRWQDWLWFYEYFHGDTGAGLGASHQTGWTGLVGEFLLHR